jgi:hypothetical protein
MRRVKRNGGITDQLNAPAALSMEGEKNCQDFLERKWVDLKTVLNRERAIPVPARIETTNLQL